ncbi:unnamed protein product [Dibothriocephalus latus]|uniref:Uncharacterized protein n=1 Tax=Dibothriocephalus latus TaxID=60516 RepID=A0A3P7LWA0_DIBLA|nr:unnamed protein product [Dibothriocephalus latus]
MTSGPTARSRSRQRPPQSLESVYSLAENAVTFLQKYFTEIEEKFRGFKFVQAESLKKTWTKVAAARRGINLATLTEAQCKNLADELGGESGGASYVDKVKKLQELAIVSQDMSSLFNRLDKKLTLVLTDGLCVYCVSLIELTEQVHQDVQEYEDFIADQNQEFAQRLTELKQNQQRWTNYTRDMSSTVRNFEKLEGIFLEVCTAWDVITSCIDERIARDKSYPEKLTQLINQSKEEIEELKQEYLLIGENEQQTASQQRQRKLQLEKCKRHRKQLRTSLAHTKKAHKFCSDRLAALEREVNGTSEVKQAEDENDSDGSDEDGGEEGDRHTESEQNESDTCSTGSPQRAKTMKDQSSNTKTNKKGPEKPAKGKKNAKSTEDRKEQTNKADEETENEDLKDADTPTRGDKAPEPDHSPNETDRGRGREADRKKKETRQASRSRPRPGSENEGRTAQSTAKSPVRKRNEKPTTQQKTGGSTGSNDSRQNRSIEQQKKQQMESYRRRNENMQKEEDQLREQLAKVEKRISDLQKEIEDIDQEDSFNDGRRAEIQAEISRLEVQIIDCRAILHRRGRGQTLMELQKTGKAKGNQKSKCPDLLAMLLFPDRHKSCHILC